MDLDKIDIADRVIVLIALFVFAPVSWPWVQSWVFLVTFLVVQTVSAAYAAFEFGKLRNNIRKRFSTKCTPSSHDIQDINSLFLRKKLAECKVRFGLVALAVVAYLILSSHRCRGYEGTGLSAVKQGWECDQPAKRKLCAALMHSFCACFYYTLQISQWVYLTKQSHGAGSANGTVPVLLDAAGTVAVTAALAYGLSVNLP